MKRNKLSRRDFLHLSVVTGTGALLAACQVATAPAGEGGRGSGARGCNDNSKLSGIFRTTQRLLATLVPGSRSALMPLWPRIQMLR